MKGKRGLFWVLAGKLIEGIWCGEETERDEKGKWRRRVFLFSTEFLCLLVSLVAVCSLRSAVTLSGGGWVWRDGVRRKWAG